MATTFEWTAPEAITTYANSTLNGLTDGSFASSAGNGAIIANETGNPGLYPYMALELWLSSLSPAAGAFVDVWIYPTMDGTNYPNPRLNLQTTNLLTTFQLDTTAANTQRLIRGNVLIPPLDFRLDVRNKAGVSFNAASNHLKYRRYYDQGV